MRDIRHLDLRRLRRLRETLGLVLGVAVIFATSLIAAPRAGWGIDAGDTTLAIDDRTLDGYVAMLRDAGIGWVRVRGPNTAALRLHEHGFRVDSFVALGTLPVEQRGDALPEDLLAVFDAARRMQRQYGRFVDAWEMVGEPDVGYCRDLPDRVAAFQKAVYLGIKSEVPRESPGPIVLMGALALPPGPWLERASANGLLDYTDAYNFHFYGYAEDLPAEIAAHRRHAAAGDPLPIWVTECGANLVPAGDFLNSERRADQATFTVSTADQAARAPGVAMFMPFVLAGRNDPHALTLGPTRPLPAWTSYATCTRTNAFPDRPLARPTAPVNPVVLQWLPDLATAIPHKMSGSYRFWQRDPICGVVRVYNFGTTAVRGSVAIRRMEHVRVRPGDNASGGAAGTPGGDVRFGDVSVPAHGRIDLALVMTPAASGYFFDACDVRFLDSDHRESRAVFGVETQPDPADFTLRPLAVEMPPGGSPPHGDLDGADVTSRSGPWCGLNGLEVSAQSGSVRLRTRRPDSDPVFPPVAVASLPGLPRRGFLRLQLDPPAGRRGHVRVDLVDRFGQRFTISENDGASYFGPVNDLWLNLADFGLYSWCRCTEQPVLHPEDVDQIRLRWHLEPGAGELAVHLSIAVPASGTATSTKP